MAGTGASKMVDPIAYRAEEQGNITPNTDLKADWTYDPAKLKNPDDSLNMYGDDSSEANYKNPATVGGRAEKYTGEGVKTSDVVYNPDITTKDLNPDYLYGREAQMYGSENNGYISERNDNIASALYNEGRVSKEEVADFLNKQKGFQNSTEEERLNTIESVWKRLGKVAGDGNENENKTDGNTEGDNSALKNMEDDLLKDTTGKLYGKNTADDNDIIKTLQDSNSVERRMAESRIKNFKQLQATSSDALAAAIVSGAMATDTQAMTDLMQYDPAKYQEVQQKVKEFRGQKTIDAITKGEYNAESEAETKKKSIENEKTSLAESMSNSDEDAAEILKSLDESLASNSTASSAEGTMANLMADINKLNTRMKNLKQEASKLFKGDVPQYIVNAYVANKSQEIQDKIKELQYNYDMAYSRYQTELNNAWKEKEYDLSLRNMKLQEDKFAFERQKANIQNNQIVWQGGEAYEIKYTENGVSVGKATIMQQYAESGMKGQGLKNNNPGNIKDTTFGNVIGTGANGMAQFATPEDGFDALVEKIKFNQTNPNSRYYGKTIAEYFQIYAPASDGNNPVAYANSVAKQLGVSVNTPISQLDPTKFAAIIAKHDSGYDYSTYGQFRKGSSGQTIVDEDTIQIPDSVYQVSANKSVDPNSETGRQLREAYIKKYKETLSNGELVADADGKNTAAYQVISDDGTTPISFRQRIYNLVPATLKNSDTELKNLYRIAKDLYVAGYSPDEAAMVFYGLDPRDDKTGLLKPLIYTARTSGKKLDESFYGNLGSLLDAGNNKQAVRLVENNVLSEDEREQEATAISIIRKIQTLEEKLEGAENSVGPFEGTVAKWSNKYIKGGGDSAKLAADIANIYSQIRKELMGSNVTDTELKANEGLFPDLNDKMDTIKVKLSATKDSLINDVNGTRSLYDLPQIDEYTLVDLGARSYLYDGIDTSAMDVKTNTNWG